MSEQDGDGSSERFETLLAKFDTAMLVSIAGDHSLHARPMAIAEQRGPQLVFSTSDESPKVAEVRHRSEVAVLMQDKGAYLAVSGRAKTIEDRARIHELWQPAWKLWFPEGPEDPHLVLIEIEPQRAEYWDRSGRQRLEFLWEAGKALSSGRRVEAEELSGHGRLSFS